MPEFSYVTRMIPQPQEPPSVESTLQRILGALSIAEIGFADASGQPDLSREALEFYRAAYRQLYLDGVTLLRALERSIALGEPQHVQPEPDALTFDYLAAVLTGWNSLSRSGLRIDPNNPALAMFQELELYQQSLARERALAN